MKKYILILLIAASCSEGVSECYTIKQQSIEVRKRMEQSTGEEYDRLKAEYLDLKSQYESCYRTL